MTSSDRSVRRASAGRATTLTASLAAAVVAGLTVGAGPAAAEEPLNLPDAVYDAADVLSDDEEDRARGDPGARPQDPRDGGG